MALPSPQWIQEKLTQNKVLLKLERRRMVFIISLITLAIDQGTKFLVEANFQLFHSHPVIEGILYMTLIHNTGAAFGILRNQQWLVVAMVVGLFVIFLRFYHRIPKNNIWQKIALGLAAGGALGNLFDRIIRGYVVDFIDIRIWPVFNFADAALTIAVIIYIYQLFLLRGREEIDETGN